MGLIAGQRIRTTATSLIIDGGAPFRGSLTNLYQRLSPEEKAACLSEDTYGTHPIAGDDESGRLSVCDAGQPRFQLTAWTR